ncbi:MAG: DNA polymerase I [Deltaproteobacteria bacterium]|nr:MAG: DNA polymerase I [Deltaproteobacteria bacterium]
MRLFLIDGSSYLYRAYFALPHLSNRKGEPTGAILGFVNMLQKVLREGKPTHAAVVFDAPGPTFRHALDAFYKANRPPMPEDLAQQVEGIHAVVRAMNLPLLMEEGWEADDIIGTLALEAVEKGYEVVIVTGDKDFLQLLRPGLTIYDGMHDRWLDEATARKKFGVPPAQVIDAMALIGDSSDNVPGVKGIGPKTAASLLERFGTLDALLERTGEISSPATRRKIEAGRDDALRSRELVRIATDVPLSVHVEDLAVKAPDTERLRELFRRWEFSRLLEQLTPEQAISMDAYETVLEEVQLEAVVRRLREAPAFALDTETTSRDPMRAELVGLSVATEGGWAAYIPVGHRYMGAPPQLGREAVLEALRPLIEDPQVKKYLQNAKYDWIVLKRAGVTLRGVAADPMLLDYLLDPGQPSHGLDALAQRELGHSAISFKAVAGSGKAQKTFDAVPLEQAAPYACEDADLTYRLAERLKPRVEEAGLWELYESLEAPLSMVLARMEMAGVKVDVEKLNALSAAYGERIARLEAEIHALAGRPFSILSPKQLAVVLFEDLGLPVKKRTKTGPSTDVTVLEALAEAHPLPRAVLQYRALTKLKSTYIDALPALVHPETGRIHTSFSQTTAATGRLSSSDPNLQNIPIRTEDGRRIREAFVAEKGAVLLSADYSQIELRILAALAEDPALIEAFRQGEDIHTRTASEILGVPAEAVTPEQRRIAKAINFGILYGMSAFRLARDLGLERREAQAFIDEYFRRYAGVKRWIDRTLEEAREHSMVRTLFGRRRILPDLHSQNRNVRAAAERIAVNTPIQGTAADIIKKAMLLVDEGLAAESPGARMILQVHDELVLEVPEADAERVAAWLRHTMEGVVQLSVPLQVEVGMGANWAQAH